MIRHIIFISFFILQQLYAQMHNYLLLPRSAESLGLGGQNVNLEDPVAAMSGNPANLIYEDGVTFSFFRNPFYFFYYTSSQPLSSFIITGNYKNENYFGLEYNNWNLDEGLLLLDPNNNYTIKVKSIERSFSLAFAKKIGRNFSIGSKITYGRTFDLYNSKALFISAGISYSTMLFDRPAVFNFSFLNFGDKIKTKTKSYSLQQSQFYDEEFFSEPPSQIKLGSNYKFLNSSLITSNVTVEFARMIINHSNGIPDNSLKALFKSWDRFPDDLNFRLGFGFYSKKISLGKGFGFNSNYYVGYESLNNGVVKNLAFGTSLLISYRDLTFGFGYSGYWFAKIKEIFGVTRGYETFNFILKQKINWRNGNNIKENYQAKPQKYLLSFGISYCSPIGILKSNYMNNLQYKGKLNLMYGFNLEFFLNEHFSYLTSITYWKAQENFTFTEYPFFSSLKFGVENFALMMGLGIHQFIDSFNGFYVQAKVGVMRRNPLEKYFYPDYDYYPILAIATGYTFKLFNKDLYLDPNIELLNYFVQNSRNNEILGLKQINFGLKVGYNL